jgi:hypothetical protein
MQDQDDATGEFEDRPRFESQERIPPAKGALYGGQTIIIVNSLIELRNSVRAPHKPFLYPKHKTPTESPSIVRDPNIKWTHDSWRAT